MSDQDPTRPQQPVPGPQPPEPTTVVRTTETAGPPRGPVPPGPPRSGAVSTGVAIGAALAVGLLGLLVGFLIWGGDDDDDAAAPDTVEDTVPDDAEADEVEAERDALALQVEDLNGQLEERQSQLDEVSQERDDLLAQLEEQGDQGEQIETVPAPDVVDGTVDDAQDAADDNGWVLVERTVEPDGNDPGTVVAQYPDPETPMIEGSVLVVDVAGEPADG